MTKKNPRLNGYATRNTYRFGEQFIFKTRAAVHGYFLLTHKLMLATHMFTAWYEGARVMSSDPVVLLVYTHMCKK